VTALPNQAWRIALYLFLVTATFGFLQPFHPLYMSAAGFSKTQIGLATSLGTGLALLIQPLLGKLSDRLDRRRPFIFGTALAAGLAYLAFPYAEGFPAFLILTAVGANGTLYLTAAGGTLVGRMLGGKVAGGATYANLRLWGSVGYVVVALLSGLMVSLNGPVGRTRADLDPIFRTGPWLFIAIALLAAFLPDRRNAAGVVATGPPARLTPNLRRFLVAYFLYILALYGASGYISLLLQELGATGLWLTATFVGGVVVEIFVMRSAGRLSDEYGRRPALAISFLLLPIRLMLYVPAMAAWHVAGVQLLHGINFGIMGAVAIAFANDLAEEGSHGRAQARLAAAAGFAGAIGPWMLGAAADAVGIRWMFAVAAGIALAGAAVFMFGVEDSHADSRSVAERGPVWLRPILVWLDSPRGRG